MTASPGRPSVVTRRALVRRGTLAAAGLAVPALLAGCGDSSDGSRGPARGAASTTIGYELGEDLDVSLPLNVKATARARTVGLRTEIAGGDPRRSDPEAALEYHGLDLWVERRGTVGAVVLRADAVRDAQVAPRVAAARRAGIPVVAFVVPIPGASARIVVDPARAAEQLVAHLASWTRRKGQRSGEIVLATTRPATTTPESALAAPAAAALRAALARELPRWRVAETLGLADAASASDLVGPAMRRHPKARAFVAWDSQTTISLSDGVKGELPYDGTGDYWVGGLSLSGEGADGALFDGGPSAPQTLRCFVVPRVDELVAAMVDLPRTLLRGGRAADVEVPSSALSPGTAAAERYMQQLQV